MTTLPAAAADVSHRCMVVIMGAAVWSSGEPSRAMRRRVRGALASTQGCAESSFIVSGALGKFPPSEALVMAGLLLDAGIPEGRIVLDQDSHDTLQSVRNCTRLLHSLPPWDRIIVSSDTYHMPRCRWLFRLCGVRTVAAHVEDGLAETPLPRWVYYFVREAAALPWDTFLLLAERVNRRFRGAAH